MLFIDNKYTSWYYNIITNAQLRISSKDTYSETHHIIPKSLNGGNDQINLVELTAREHFICHWLLTKMLTDKKDKARMIKALERMTVSNDYQLRYKINSKLFEIIRKNAAIAHSILLTGKKGRKHTQATKDKIAHKALGRLTSYAGQSHSEETKIKMRGPRPHVIPHKKGKTNLPPSARAKYWSITNTSTNLTEIKLSLRKWAKDNNFNSNTVDDYVRKFGRYKHYHIQKIN
jgi:hypothetical protein